MPPTTPSAMNTSTCKFCNKKTRVDSLRNHVIAIHFGCIKCDLKFPSKEDTLSHFEEEHPSISLRIFAKNKSCSLCDYVGRNNQALRMHLRLSHNHCLDCKSLFENREECLRHFKEVHNFEPQPKIPLEKCKFCSKEMTKNSIRDHIITVHFQGVHDQ